MTDQRETILAVDDMPENLRLLHSLLEEHGYRVLTCEDGPSALRIAAQTPPDLVLLDVCMPGMDGYEVCRRLREQAPLAHVPILFVSALHETWNKTRGFQAGAVDYITKPYELAEVLARVETHLKLRRYQRQIEATNHRLKEMTGELQERNDDLERLHQEKNRFLGTAAHDLRNPLAVVSAYAQLLLSGMEGALNPEQAELANAIVRQSGFMLRLVNELLDFAAIEAGEVRLRLERANLAEIAAQNVTFNQLLAARKHVELVLEPQDGTFPQIELDRGKIDQVLNNLITNAVTHSTEGGAVHVRVIRSAGEVQLSVRDGGPGIAPEDRDRLFAPFVQGMSAKPGGAGLGLAIVRRAVEEHGGRVEVKSELGHGATFTVTLPVGGRRDRALR